MRELHVFAGGGGGILGGMLLGHSCVCAVEINPYRRKVLLQRQRDGVLPRFPIWDDVRTFDGRPWRGIVDAVCGGFPCKGISVAGSGTGLDHEESGLWREQARIIGDVRPSVVWVENSPALTTRGGVRVIGDLAALGYDCRWGVVSAADAIWSFETPCIDHLRERIWIYGEGADADAAGLEEQQRAEPGGAGCVECGGWWGVEPGLGRVAHGVAHRVDRLAAIGDGQVPAVVALAWRMLRGREGVSGKREGQD